MSVRNDTALLHDQPLPVQAKLAAGWVSLMLVYAYVDILGFYQPGVIDDILAGVVWEFEISQTWAFGALALMTLPILMVLLSVTLPARANRVANLVMGALYIPVSAVSAVGEEWLWYFALAVGLEVGILAIILRTAWSWPRTSSMPARERPADGRLVHG